MRCLGGYIEWKGFGFLEECSLCAAETLYRLLDKDMGQVATVRMRDRDLYYYKLRI